MSRQESARRGPPIFLIGLHGSGTTLTYDILGRHPEVGFFNRYNKRLPRLPRLAWLLTRCSGYDRPMEAQPIWDRHRHAADDRLDRSAATPQIAAHYRELVDRVMRIRDAQRFIAKYPRFSLRVPWLDAIFDDALFVHVTRDWRAVVASIVHRKQKRERRRGGWFGIYSKDWKELRELSHEDAATRQFIAGTQAIEAEVPRLGDRYITFAYEWLCADPVSAIESLCKETGLSWSDEFAATIPKELRNANYRWRKRLGEETVERLRGVDPQLLARWEVAEVVQDG